MKLLISILSVYLVVIIVFLLGCFVLSPMILSYHFNDEKYLFLFLINIPVLLGAIIDFTSPPINYRPSR